jgi:hypothetical protein
LRAKRINGGLFRRHKSSCSCRESFLSQVFDGAGDLTYVSLHVVAD